MIYLSYTYCFCRSRLWVIASGRDDLLTKLDSLNKNYRLCSDHFESRMFSNEKRNRLICDAVPTIFPSLEGSSKMSALDHNYSRLPLQQLSSIKRPSLKEAEPNIPSKKICILQDITIQPAGMQVFNFF